MEKPKRKRLSPQEALVAMQRFCAYQDRCHQEVRTRLIEHQVYGDDLEDILSDLITENFLNEERFAKSYARGKFRIKKWGRLRIRRELKFRQISEYCIKKGMLEIEDEDYYATLLDVLSKKDNLLTDSDPYKRKKKLVDHATRKGFEYHLITEALQELSTP